MAIDPDLLLVVTGNEIGHGPADLGERLTELWLGRVAAEETKPAKMLFLNSAVLLTTEGSPHVETLRKLEEAGTDLVSCITCLTYHDRMEKVVVGTRGDMKGTVEDMLRFRKVVTV
jgi:prolyl-tRNA synthetase